MCVTALRPAMRSAAATPSSSALCASIGPLDKVTDRPHPRKVRAVFCINFNKSSFVELKTDDRRIQRGSERNAADGDDQAVHPHFAVFSVLVFVLDNNAVTVILNTVDVNTEFHIQTLLLKCLQGFSAPQQNRQKAEASA